MRKHETIYLWKYKHSYIFYVKFVHYTIFLIQHPYSLKITSEIVNLSIYFFYAQIYFSTYKYLLKDGNFGVRILLIERNKSSLIKFEYLLTFI